jgi:hypothetical protein
MKKVGKILGLDVYESDFMPQNTVLLANFKGLKSFRKLLNKIEKMPNEFYIINVKK